jgi:glycosyltransferase involved in cell wall biosynthesis
MRVLIHNIQSKGGLAEHVHYQARAFTRGGDEVVVLAPSDYLEGREPDYEVLRIYRPLHSRGKSGSRFSRAISLVARTLSFLGTQWRLAWEIVRRRPDFVLLDSYMEYLSPLWVWPHLILARFHRVPYVANLHDPVRDFQVGPRWWHKLSVQLAYAPLKVAVVHQHLSDRGTIPNHVALTEAPVGVYDLAEVATDPVAIRKSWGAGPGHVVFFAFGFIRDNKNLDLLIKALETNPEAFLVVMGSAQSSKNRPLQFYRDLAEQAGVADRVVFREEFVADQALGGYFSAADYIAITYNKDFHSQSGVLNIAARAKKPVLASSGDSPLEAAVTRFKLGKFVTPDDVDALATGMKSLSRRHLGLDPDMAPEWEAYEAYASWDSNAAIIRQAIKGMKSRSAS